MDPKDADASGGVRFDSPESQDDIGAVAIAEDEYLLAAGKTAAASDVGRVSEVRAPPPSAPTTARCTRRKKKRKEMARQQKFIQPAQPLSAPMVVNDNSNHVDANENEISGSEVTATGEPAAKRAAPQSPEPTSRDSAASTSSLHAALHVSRLERLLAEQKPVRESAGGKIVPLPRSLLISSTAKFVTIGFVPTAAHWALLCTFSSAFTTNKIVAKLSPSELIVWRRGSSEGQADEVGRCSLVKFRLDDGLDKEVIELRIHADRDQLKIAMGDVPCTAVVVQFSPDEVCVLAEAAEVRDCHASDTACDGWSEWRAARESVLLHRVARLELTVYNSLPRIEAALARVHGLLSSGSRVDAMSSENLKELLYWQHRVREWHSLLKPLAEARHPTVLEMHFRVAAAAARLETVAEWVRRNRPYELWAERARSQYLSEAASGEEEEERQERQNEKHLLNNNAKAGSAEAVYADLLSQPSEFTQLEALKHTLDRSDTGSGRSAVEQSLLELSRRLLLEAKVCDGQIHVRLSNRTCYGIVAGKLVYRGTYALPCDK